MSRTDASAAASATVEDLPIEEKIEAYRRRFTGDAYELSKALIAVSALGGDQYTLYQSTLTDMLRALGLDPAADTYTKAQFSNGKAAGIVHLQTWLLGRALLATGTMNDTEMANKLLPLMISLLEDTANPYQPWAKAYTVAYLSNSTNRDHHRAHFSTYFKVTGFKAFDPKDPGSPAEVIWERIFYLAASMSRPRIYDGIMTALIKELGQTTIEGVFNMMRYDQTDFPAWAVSYMANVAAEAGDFANAECLQRLLTQKFGDTRDDGDVMIASAYTPATIVLLEASQSTLGYSELSADTMDRAGSSGSGAGLG